MANGFLQNSFKLGTPARGGGDLLSAFLGINTNPDVQLKGQLAGARLGNLDSRTRRSNILGQQDAIELSDMQELRNQFVKGSPERQAVIDPRFASGQLGLVFMPRKAERRSPPPLAGVPTLNEFCKNPFAILFTCIGMVELL